MKPYATLIIFYISVFLSGPLSGQRFTKLKQERINGLINGRLSYLATLRTPGLSAGIEVPVISKYYFQGDTISLKYTKARFIIIQYSFYTHKTFHINHNLALGFVWRRTGRKGWFLDFEPQIGISRTFIDGTTYRVKANGIVEKKTLAGDWFLSSSIGFSIGKQFPTPFEGVEKASVFVRPSIYSFLPYNNFIYLRPAIQLGLRAPLHHSLTHSHPSITKVRSRKNF